MTRGDERIGSFSGSETDRTKSVTDGPIVQALSAYLTSPDGNSMSALDLATLQETAGQLVSNFSISASQIQHDSNIALIGKVQSGKTTGMAMAIAAFADQGVDCFVVLTGTKKTLTAQTTDELREMFQMNIRSRDWIWTAPISTATDERVLTSIAQACSTRPTSNSQRNLLLLCCMKEDDHLELLMRQIKDAKSFRSAEVAGRFVVFDDEGDQASANTAPRRRATPSTINDLIVKIKNELSPVGLIPVTATPQALLVQDRNSPVRPNSSVLLQPGSSYVGGRELFIDHRAQFVKTIPPGDLSKVTQLELSPPASLLSALASFLLAVELLRAGDGTTQIASMLIHPHQQTRFHVHVKVWVETILNGWASTASSSPNLTGEEMYEVFRQAALDLASSSSTRIASGGYSTTGDELIRWIRNACARIDSARFGIRKISDRDTFERSEWDGSCDTWIFIGGEILGRGFVVKGLITTYMPRDVAAGNQFNLDTLQQRARFFGYKRSYLDLLRGWFNESLIEKYTDYVDHEDYMWEFLRYCQDRDVDLDGARTVFQLSGAARPTRPNANRTKGRASNITSKWLTQNFLYSNDLSQNLEIFRNWRESVTQVKESWSPPQFTASPAVQFESWVVNQSKVIELLQNWKAISIDHAMFYVLNNQIRRFNGDELIRVVDMSSKSNHRVEDQISKRSLKTDSINWIQDPWVHPYFARINNLQSNPSGSPDTSCFDNTFRMTIQVHKVQPQLSNEDSSRVQVAALAVYQGGRDMGRVFGEAI